ncbi:hydrogenase maturation protein [Dongshaea marina]|uniref:hydrogenase maturation protein n=1 Tax=Dongshaea marina TaxID=2047966 RepID=UPI000D3E6BCE|nr:hydrogenase maturation protein [Dongshaea marina]
MKILLLTHTFNGLSQRMLVELRRDGHQVSVELDIHDLVIEQAVELFEPDLILAPFLKRKIPASVWQKIPCLIVHPGPVGDQGPSALDWAVLEQPQSWGVTVLQAEEKFDAGPVWASREFAMRPAPKSALYRHEVTEAAVEATREAITRILEGSFKPEPPRSSSWKPLMKRAQRQVDWLSQTTSEILLRVHASDSVPGALATLGDGTYFLYGATCDSQLKGEPGRILGWRGDAVCVATRDGAVWIKALRRYSESCHESLKLPATELLADEILSLPELVRELRDDSVSSYRENWLEIRGEVGCLHFDPLNGALNPAQARRLAEATRQAKQSGCRVLLLSGSEDFWCNGIQLNSIESSENPADASWESINAMNDWVLELIESTGLYLIAAMQGNAAAGGAFAALACDRVWARDGVVLNPHYKNMGNLYGSEYWTYLLPKRCQGEQLTILKSQRLPMGAPEAAELGLVDEVFSCTPEDFMEQVWCKAQQLLDGGELEELVRQKSTQRQRDEAKKPLAKYREEELGRMRLNFYGCDPSYHVARYDFVRKIPHSRTPIYLATHRDRTRQG